jgi:hypothetical protein
MQTLIKSGFGFITGPSMQDFARAKSDIPIYDVKPSGPRCVEGWIDGDMDSPLGFMRRKQVFVRVDKRCVFPLIHPK